MSKARVSIVAIVKHLQFLGDVSVTLAKKHPIPLVGILWFVMMLLALAAMDSLVAPELKTQTLQAERKHSAELLLGNESRRDPVTDDDLPAHSPTQAIQQKSRVPFWLFGAIALTCGGSVLLLNRQVSPRQSAGSQQRGPRSPSRGRSPRPVPSSSASSTSPSQPAAATSAASATSTASATSIPYPRPEASSPAQPGKVRRRRSSKSVAKKPVSGSTDVLVRSAQLVQPQEIHALDAPGGLIDDVDLRKQRSLASWLHQSDVPEDEVS